MHGDYYPVVPNMAEFHPYTLQVAFGSAKPPMTFPKESCDDLHAKVDRSFPGKDVLSDVANNVLWTPIVNTGSSVTDKKNRSTGSTRFTSLSALFTEMFERMN